MKSDGSDFSRKSAGGWIGFLIGPAFILLAGWFLQGPELAEIPEIKSVVVRPEMLDTTPRRDILGDPPIIEIDGFERTCMDCHKIFPARDDAPASLLQHQHVKLFHGINDRCRNCHDVKDRDRLLLTNGESIPYSDVVRLCARCHGPTYRDWERGMHGRTNGFWEAGLGERRRLGCTECHDPHDPRVPAMDPMMPLPSPNTLRMSLPSADPHIELEETDPLRRALRISDERLERREAEKKSGEFDDEVEF